MVASNSPWQALEEASSTEDGVAGAFQRSAFVGSENTTRIRRLIHHRPRNFILLMPTKLDYRLNGVSGIVGKRSSTID
jgi:hypothetical protein